MFFVARNDKGEITAISSEPGDSFSETLPAESPEVQAFFLNQPGRSETLSQLQSSDTPLVRVLEDLVNLMVKKNIIQFTELPPAAQEKLLERKQIRTRLSDLSTDTTLLPKEDDEPLI